MKKFEITDELKPKIIELYVDKMYGAGRVADILNIPEKPLRKFLTNEGIMRAPGTTKLYRCDDGYFNNISTEHQAYWLGVLFADGNVQKGKDTHSGRIILSSIDTQWIDLFKKDIKYSGNIYEETHKVFQKKISKISLSSEQMYQDLINLGCVPEKSMIIRIPAIPLNLMSHFIRGYFDGDGTVGVYKNSNKWNTYTLRSGFCSGSQEFLEAISLFIPTNNKTVKKTKNRNLYSINLSVNDSISLYQYMYTDATIWLPRKREKFENFLQERCSETIIGPSRPDEGIVQSSLKEEE